LERTREKEKKNSRGSEKKSSFSELERGGEGAFIATKRNHSTCSRGSGKK
jgi:hypothetical protein